MTEIVKKHLPIIVVVTLVGVATAYLLTTRVLGDMSQIDLGTFMTMTFIIPCIVMLVCSTVIALTAPGINRQLYVVIVAIGMVTGGISMFVTNAWLIDPSISASLLANSPEGTVITPILNSPFVLLRDVAAFFVVPTVGSIVGAWLGSRLHPMTIELKKGKGRKSKKKA